MPNLKRVYCSGPLFCPEEIAGMSAISETLEQAGYETFLPHRDGLERYVMNFVHSPLVHNRSFRKIGQKVSRAIFALDIYQVAVGCDALVYNMNGRVPDEGGAVETGVAFAVGKPVVLYKRDHRSVFNDSDNSMLLGLTPSFTPVNKLGDLPKALVKAALACGVAGDQEEELEKTKSHPPQYLRETIKQGERVWKWLKRTRWIPEKGPDETVKRLQELVAALEEPLPPAKS